MELIHAYLNPSKTGHPVIPPFPQYLKKENIFHKDFWVDANGRIVYPADMGDTELHEVMKTLDDIVSNRLSFEMDVDGLEAFICHGVLLPALTAKPSRKLTPEQSRYMELWADYRLYMLIRFELYNRGEDHRANRNGSFYHRRYER